MEAMDQTRKAARDSTFGQARVNPEPPSPSKDEDNNKVPTSSPSVKKRECNIDWTEDQDINEVPKNEDNNEEQEMRCLLVSHLKYLRRI